MTTTRRRTRVLTTLAVVSVLLGLALLPIEVFAYAALSLTALFGLGAAAHWKDYSTNLYGELVFAEAAAKAYKAKRDELADDNIKLAHHLDDALGRAGCAEDRLTLLETEHALCSSNVTGVVVDIAEHRKGGV
jgi:hypothetical protein